jgi:hypothetical protein
MIELSFIVQPRAPQSQQQQLFDEQRLTEISAGSINPLIPGVLGPFVPNGDLSTLIPIAMPKSLAPRTASQLMSRSPQRTGGKGTGLPKTPKIPSLDQLTNIAKGIIPKDVSKGDQIKCTNQEVSCSFLQKQAFDLQNDDDECLKIATSFDDQGKLDIAPLASSSDTVVYGITTDGLSASAWCNDIGWTLRRIYTKCRRGKVCYGGMFPLTLL